MAGFPRSARSRLRHRGRLSRRGHAAVALTRDDVERLRFAFEFQRACGIQLDWLSGVEARRLEPHLRPGLAGAVLSPNDHQVDSRRLVLALEAGVPRGGRRAARACRGASYRRRGGAGARRGRRRRALWRRRRRAAGGAWSAGLDGLPAAARPPVRPVKGQMLALRTDPAAAAAPARAVGSQGLPGAEGRWPADRRRHGRGARLRSRTDRGRGARAARGGVARVAEPSRSCRSTSCGPGSVRPAATTRRSWGRRRSRACSSPPAIIATASC